MSQIDNDASKYLSLGDTVSVDIDTVYYRATVKFIDGQMIYLKIPAFNRRPPVLTYNRTAYLINDASDNDILLMVLRLRWKDTERGEALYVFEMVRATLRNSQRKSFRMSVDGKCNVKIFSFYNAKEVVFSNRVNIYDLSEGGMALFVSNNLAVDSFAECSFFIDDEEIRVNGRIANCIETDNVGTYRCGIEFISINQKQQQLIRRYLFMEQARRLRD